MKNTLLKMSTIWRGASSLNNEDLPLLNQTSALLCMTTSLSQQQTDAVYVGVNLLKTKWFKCLPQEHINVEMSARRGCFCVDNQ